MKTFKINIAVLLCSVIFFASCEKESVKPAAVNQQDFKTHSINKNKDGGGGDEENWIIIRGVVQSATTSDPIKDAEVILFDQSLMNPIDTFYSNTLGEFEFERDSGDYAFKVSAIGFQLLQSSAYTFPDNNPVTLNLEEE
ncbi:MAG: hypothetical protein CMC96_05715 [Flavobacteriales bacterium]|nr:hypothetical protein [Flavobacteriales bacterium]|tara:strand:- start:13904 stop:14323 length:420 start_codon:yes stop_codon:yes gene_type:complete